MRFSYIYMSADYHPWGCKQQTYETTGTNMYIYYVHVDKFAYTSSNAEFRQDSESAIKKRCYQRLFSIYLALSLLGLVSNSKPATEEPSLERYFQGHYFSPAQNLKNPSTTVDASWPDALASYPPSTRRANARPAAGP